MKKTTLFPFVLAATISLGACETQTDEAPPPEELEAPEETAEEPVSIIRPDIEQPEVPEVPLEPLEVTIGFPEGGTELDAAATAALQEILGSDQIALGLPIILRGHSDAGGDDAANLRSSRTRGERVKDWLVENGIAEDRITAIAFGAQNPVEPNALPDGKPNETGRAANRRVDIEVTVPFVDNPIPAISENES